jgi:predicted nucleotidyltransferase
MTLPELRKLLSENEEKLKAFHVKSLSVFGSVARGDATAKSDIDLLVEFSKPVGYFHLFRTQEFLKELLNCDVDIATKNALHPALKDQILREAILVA